MKIKSINNKKAWEAFVLEHPQVNFLQSWNWGEFQQSLGKKVFRLGFYSGERLVGITLLIKESAKRGSYLTCPGGPLLDNKKASFKFFIKAIKQIAKEEAVVFIRIRPSLLESQKNQQFFKESGFIPAPMHMHAETTWQLDLTQSIEEILKNMRKTTRQAIKKAEKNNVVIRTTTSSQAVKRLYDLQIATAKRQGFVPFSFEFFSQQFQVFSQDNQAVIFEACVDKELIASAMIIFYGQEAVYHYAGSTLLARQVSAAHLLQWTAIQAAKERGLKRYNFWGVVPEHKPNHRFWGVTIFKKGFGGFMINYLHAQDLPMKKSYWLTYIFETLRRLYRRL